MTSRSQRIDVHHHILPPALVADLHRRNIEWTGGVPVPRWDLAVTHEAMDRLGLAAAILSVEPQIYWGDTALAARWSRHSNEFLARLVKDDSQRFGGFATLPLPDTSAALRELEYSLDTLGLDGVSMETSYDTQYPGDPAFEELFAELNRRSAVVFIHPNTIPPGATVPKLGLGFSMMEFVFDTTRAVASLLYNGTLERYPDIRFILPHAGGTVPYIAWRMSLGEMLPKLRERVPRGTMHYLKRLYYDTALSTSDNALAALQRFVPASQIVFGSDFPMAPPPAVAGEIANWEASTVIDAATRESIERGNALALFPRFARPAVETQPGPAIRG